MVQKELGPQIMSTCSWISKIQVPFDQSIDGDDWITILDSRRHHGSMIVKAYRYENNHKNECCTSIKGTKKSCKNSIALGKSHVQNCHHCRWIRIASLETSKQRSKGLVIYRGSLFLWCRMVHPTRLRCLLVCAHLLLYNILLVPPRIAIPSTATTAAPLIPIVVHGQGCQGLTQYLSKVLIAQSRGGCKPSCELSGSIRVPRQTQW